MNYDYRLTPAGIRVSKHPRIYKLTVVGQWILYKIGIAVHNHFADECTPDFNCCEKRIGKTAWLRIPQKKKE